MILTVWMIYVATAVGELTANALQMLAAGLGLASILTASGVALALIKGAGVVYLVWLGVLMIGAAVLLGLKAVPRQ